VTRGTIFQIILKIKSAKDTPVTFAGYFMN